jgi:hypothetical protein
MRGNAHVRFGGSGKRTGRKTDTAPRAGPTETARRPISRAAVRGYAVAAGRVLQVTRHATCRVPKTRPPAARRSARPVDETDAAIVDVALANQTDRYRMVTALVVRKLGRAVNRKRVLRAMLEHRLIQRRRRLDRRRRPGSFQVTRPNELVAWTSPRCGSQSTAGAT